MSLPYQRRYSRLKPKDSRMVDGEAERSESDCYLSKMWLLLTKKVTHRLCGDAMVKVKAMCCRVSQYVRYVGDWCLQITWKKIPSR